MLQRIPRKTNEHSVPREYMFKGITDSMEYEQREEIINKNNYEYTKQQYEKMGIKIIEEFDDLLFTVELPEGWEIKYQDGYWKSVIDNKSRERIIFFYKSSFYDRDAFSNFCRRYSFEISPFDDYKSKSTYEERKFKPWSLFITDCENRIKKLEEVIVNTDKEYFEMDEILGAKAIEYLDKNYPNWKDINCYWD